MLDVLVGGRPVCVKEEAEESEDKDLVKRAGPGASSSERATASTRRTSSPPSSRSFPPARARDLGFDRSMVLGYGQDDRVLRLHRASWPSWTSRRRQAHRRLSCW